MCVTTNVTKQYLSGCIVVERHSAAVADVLRFVGLTHGGIEILLATIRMDCADLHQVVCADEDRHSSFEMLSIKFLYCHVLVQQISAHLSE